MKKIVTFGELMLRLSPEDKKRFSQADRFTVHFGGAEANVAVSLAVFGNDSRYVTRFPANEIGDMAEGYLRRYGVNTADIHRGGERLGIYYLESGASLRGDKVVYDRKNSSIATVGEEEFDFKNILKDADWFHFSGIAPALSPTLAKICETACRTAKELGVTVSCDLNYRSKLWSKEEARSVMTRLMPYIDVCIANDEEPSAVLGIEPENVTVDSDGFRRAMYRETAEKIVKTFGCRYVGIVMRVQINAGLNRWLGMLSDGRNYAFSDAREVPIVDSTGGGDSFGAGLIHALLSGYSLQQSVDFAAAASCLSLSVEGDANLVTVPEVLSLAGGNVGKRVQ